MFASGKQDKRDRKKGRLRVKCEDCGKVQIYQVPYVPLGTPPSGCLQCGSIWCVTA